MTQVFVSYRRSDSEDVAGRIYDRLIACFGRESVFKDVDSIGHGSNFRLRIEQAIQTSDTICVLIAPNWSNVSDSNFAEQLVEEVLLELLHRQF